MEAPVCFDYLALPLRVLLDGGPGYEHFDRELGQYWTVVVPMIVAAALRVRESRPYLLSSGVYFVFWASSSQQMRFLIPILPLLAVAAGITASAAARALGRRSTPRARHVAFAGAVAGSLAMALGALRARTYDAPLLGLWSPTPPPGWPVPEGYAFTNSKLPVHAKLMLLNTNHGFFLERAYIADSFFEASQMSLLFAQAGSNDALAQRFMSLGLTHLYIANVDMDVHYPERLAQWLTDPLRARQIYRCADDSCVIYELNPKPTPRRG